MIKAVAWWRRFSTYHRAMAGKDSVRVGPLIVIELNSAEESIVRYVQRKSFSEEYLALASKNGSFNWNINGLRKLNPMLTNDLIVVGGRLQLASVSDTRKHPIILPKDHVVTEAVIRHIHSCEGHAGVSQTLGALRNKYWVLHGGVDTKR